MTSDGTRVSCAAKGVTPDDAKLKAIDEWEAKQKADPAAKKALDEAMEKSVGANMKDFIAGSQKCENDPDVKAIMEKMKSGDEKKEEPKK